LQLRRGVLANRLQHPEAGLAVGVRAPDEKTLLEQRIEPVEDRSGAAVMAANALGRFGPTAADEHGQPPEQPLLLLREQTVAPVDRVPQRPLALVDVARSAGQQRQPLVETAKERDGGERPLPGRRELDRERQTVEPDADLDDRRRVPVVELEPLGRRLSS